MFQYLFCHDSIAVSKDVSAILSYITKQKNEI